MYDEERNFSWANLFIKVIIVLIIILFIIWIISLVNRKDSNVHGVVTDSIFSENISKMKKVGKDYFTTEKLPEKDGDSYRITLQDMYNKKMLPTLKDKNGKECSAKNSYVSVEKIDDEYEMKVYLECDKASDYLLVTMICNDYCSKNTCDKEQTKIVDDDVIEYQYSKTVGGTYGKWSAFSDWSTTSVSENNTTDVETKVVKENYTYDKTVTENKLMGNATCPTVNGYTLASNNNGVCNYSKIEVIPEKPTCPSVSGYTLVNRTGFNCSYVGTTTSTSNPKCPTVSGYTNTGINGFTCNYSKTTTSKTDYTLSYYSTGSGSYIPKDTSIYHYVQKSADYVYNCDGSCGAKWHYTYTIYKKVYKTITENTTMNANCPIGYKASGNKCVQTTTSNIVREANCPNEYYKTGTICAKNKVDKTTRSATCYNNQTMENGKCYQKVNSVVKETGTKDVTYYRYRTRKITGGSVDYKWSNSNNDKKLLDEGYKLTGKTRNKEMVGK